jgi:hypothetical protein
MKGRSDRIFIATARQYLQDLPSLLDGHLSPPVSKL